MCVCGGGGGGIVVFCVCERGGARKCWGGGIVCVCV